MGCVSFACWRSAISADSAPAISYLHCSRAYSAERLFALDEYCRATPRWRVLLVLVPYSTPALSILLATDAIPLQDTRQGWSAKTGFWMRMFASSSVTAWVVLAEAQLVMPEMDFSLSQRTAITTAVGAMYMDSLMPVEHRWRFSIPFIFAIGTVPFAISLNLLVVGSLGCADRQLLWGYFKFASFVGLERSMLIVYPAYNAAFLSLEGVPQLAFVLLLQVIKIGYKYLTTTLQSEEEDLVPGLQASTDIFDALYMTKCVESTCTLVVALGIIEVSLVQSYIAVYLLAKQTQSLEALITREAAERKSQGPKGLLPHVFKLLGETEQLVRRFGRSASGLEDSQSRCARRGS